MRRWPVPVVLLGSALVIALGCQEATFTVPTVPAGVVTVFTRSFNGAYVARPEGLFALAGGAPSGDSRSTVDTCELGDYQPQSTNVTLEHINAGDSILFTVAADTTVLRPVRRFGITVYAASPADVSVIPGAAVRFTIPGAVGGFPATTIASLVPPAITSITPIPTRPRVDQPLTVSWQPAGDDSSRFEVLLIYATQGAIDFDQQIVCGWRDDGASAIPGALLAGWASSELQRIEVTRYRTQRRVMGDTVLFMLSTFDTVPQVAP